MAEKSTTTIVSVSDRLGITTCNVREAKDFVKLCLKTGDVPCLVGSTGIGKTQLMRQVAKEMDGLLLPLFLAHREREDVIGIPFPSKDTPTYRFLIEETIYNVLNHKGQVIIFLDEFNRADAPVLNSAFTMIEDRVYGSVNLPPNIGIVTCMNPSEEGYLVNGCEQDHAFRRRLCFTHVVADHLTWVEYATNEGKFDEDVIAFIRAKPMFLDGEAERLAAKVGPNPAAWEKVSRTVTLLKGQKGSFRKASETPGLRNKIAGHVGVPAMVQFMEYALRSETERVYPEDFLSAHSEDAIKSLKMTVAKNKNDIIAEAVNGIALLIITRTPPVKEVVNKLARIYKVLPPDMVRSLSQNLHKLGCSVDKTAYVVELSRAVSEHPECQDALREMYDAVEGVKAEIAGGARHR